jgi:hypothetical protein
MVKILDFGIAKATEPERLPMAASDLTLTGTQVGTVPYMSPEQVRGESIDRRSDVWAFGCVLYELLTGLRAFGRKTVAETFNAILEHDPDLGALPHGTPSAIRNLLADCLWKEPRRRLEDISDAGAILRQALTTERRPGRRLLAGLASVGGAMAFLALWGKGPLEDLIRLTPAEVSLLVSDGGSVVIIGSLIVGLVAITWKLLGNVRSRRFLTSVRRGSPIAWYATYALFLLLSLAMNRHYTAGILVLCAAAVWIVRGWRGVDLTARWALVGPQLLILLLAYQLEGWSLARAGERRDEALDVYVVLPFDRLNDEDESELLDVSEHYRDALAAVFRDLRSVRVLPSSFNPEVLRSFPPQCDYRDVVEWLEELKAAPDIVLCSTVDLFDDAARHSSLLMVSTVRRAREGMLDLIGERIRYAATYDDIEWLALRSCFEVLRVLDNDPDLGLEPEESDIVKRRILEEYATFLSFRQPSGADAEARVELLLTAPTVVDDDLEGALDAYSSPVDLAGYATRHELARQVATGRALRE